MNRIAFLGILAVFFLNSCQKQAIQNGNAVLFSSTDSVYFDTVFTSIGAVTQQIKLLNPNNQNISISSITLAGGALSPFIINVDGSPGPTVSDLRIAANDSLYIFVTVYIKPGSLPTAFLLQDSILIHYNGLVKIIRLSAWGQNAHFLKNQVIAANISWPNDLPYVLYGGLRIDSGAILTIAPGTHIYMHADAAIYVDGSLIVAGDSGAAHQVLFTGDRLDLPYANYPGSWPGIVFDQSSRDNQLNYAVFQNSYHGLEVDGLSSDMNPKLSLNQCIINNSLQEGILGIEASIKAVNCLVSNCGQNLVLSSGGMYQFEFCTVVSYSNDLISHTLPVLTLSNGAAGGNPVFTNDLSADFVDCIFWGSQSITDEAQVTEQGTTAFNVVFDHSILKQLNYPSQIDSSFLWLNTNPQFVDTAGPGNAYNFQLLPGSPALQVGIGLGVPIDLNGNPRPFTLPDLGSYERQ
jgi:hypothetical protein